VGVTQSREQAFDLILRSRAIECVFQPIIDLPTGRTVAFEALARGPAGTGFVSPDALFSYAAGVGRLAELDWVCRAAASRAALAADLPPDVPLFVNVEPAASRTRCPEDLADVIRTASQRLHIVVEVTERSLDTDPAGLLAAVAALRGHGHRIALDDVGSDKLDRKITQGRITPHVLAVVNAVLAEAERTGATILAEGIETVAHEVAALSMGATLGQGWLYGRAAALPARFPTSTVDIPRLTVSAPTAGTPFEVARTRRPSTQASEPMLAALSRHLEEKATAVSAPAVLLATFQRAANFDDLLRQRYASLAARGILTAVYAADMPAQPGPRIRGCPVIDDDPMAEEWNVIVMGSYFAGGLFARPQPQQTGERDRVFDVIVTYERNLILEAARSLIGRLPPLP
jgi:EAL domain-containing protein (putative c-di-GMP-specific phosphodiesterase class I)